MQGFGDDETFWKKVGQDIVKTAVNTLVEEGIEATVEIWKKRRLKIQKDELDKQNDKGGTASTQAPDPAGSGDRKDYPGRDAGGEEPEEPDEGDEAEAAIFGDEKPARQAGASVESFASYVGRGE